MTTAAKRATGHLYLNGAFVPAGAREGRSITEKATGRTLAVVPEATAADVDEAVSAAAAAQPAWAALPVTERTSILRAAAKLLGERRSIFEEWLVREGGATRAKAAGEVSLSIDELEHAAFLAPMVAGELLPSGVRGRVNIVERRPVGTVALITAWNFPLQIALRIMAPALAFGNVVVLKPAPATPVSGGLLIAELMHDLGLPAGVLQVVPGDVAGPALVAHLGVDMVHFTGSQAAGKMVAAEAGKTLKKVALELGGNSASVVLPDANLDLAAQAAAQASFYHQGQVCIATSRHLVCREVAEDYAERLVAYADALSVGDPASEDIDLGPLISERQLSRVAGLVQNAVASGAHVATGGKQEGPFYWPTVVTDVIPGMPLFEEEIFGPVAPVTVVDSIENALALVNGVSHALSAAVFTEDLDLGWAFAERVRAGMVHVNDATALHEVHVPFGGVGQSGVGERLGGGANADLLTERRWLSLQRRDPIPQSSRQ